MAFIHDDFLLPTETARRLYHEVARALPIIDYHTHLSAREVAGDRRFAHLAEIWLGGDHYKWRAMRANGEPERVCTGEASPWEKHLAWCRTVPACLRNPLYHWSHLELKRYFGIDCLISQATAAEIWEGANARLSEPDFSARGILRRFDVRVVCTTDDPADDLAWHHALADDPSAPARVLPTFRPDRALAIDQTTAWNAWCDRLGEAAGCDTGTYAEFKDALRRRHDDFHRVGGRLSDHGLQACYCDFVSEAQAATIFAKARVGATVTSAEQRQFASAVMLFSGQLDAEKGWTKQLHLGVMRNNNARLFQDLGPDAGFDSIGDFPQGYALSRYLDRLDQANALPRIILYNLNPADNYLFATMCGNFQDGAIAGKVQYGSAWWFLDQKDGIEAQLNTLSQVGLLSRFVGMLTDSRSFLSFPRHEYFRRIFCKLIGDDVEAGLIPCEWDLYAPLVRKVCYENARDFFGLCAGQRPMD